MLFPLVALAMRAICWRHLIGATLVLILFQQLLIWHIRPLEGADFWFQYAMPITFAPYFAMGLIAWKFGAGESHRAFIAALVVLAAVLGFSLVSQADVYRAQHIHLLLSIGAGLAVLFAYRARCPAALGKMALWLGNLSYALYLTHWFTFEIVRVLAGRLGIAATPLHFAVFIAAALAVSLATYVLFERPAKRFIMSRAGQSTTATPLSTAP